MYIDTLTAKPHQVFLFLIHKVTAKWALPVAVARTLLMQYFQVPQSVPWLREKNKERKKSARRFGELFEFG